MKYVPPIGGAANDSYIDGNPAGGIEGSPVPAAAIEDPQREIVQVINDAGLTPTDADLGQLSEAITALMTAGGSSIAALTDLNDTPANYTGQSEKLVAVNTAETAVEFIAAPITPEAWVAFDAAGVITASKNVTSVTKNATGDYTVNLAVTMASTSYAVLATNADSAAGGAASILVKQSGGSAVMTTTSFTLLCKNFNDAGQDPLLAFASVIGTTI